MREVSRRPTDSTANIEYATLLRKRDPLSLIACGGQAARMEMLDGSKDFRVQILWIVPQLSQRGVDPRKHPRSRPMRLNIRRPFSHGLVSRRLYEGTTVMSELQSAEIDPQHGAVPTLHDHGNGVGE